MTLKKITIQSLYEKHNRNTYFEGEMMLREVVDNNRNSGGYSIE
jgi:hypothetical protein